MAKLTVLNASNTSFKELPRYQRLASIVDKYLTIALISFLLGSYLGSKLLYGIFYRDFFINTFLSDLETHSFLQIYGFFTLSIAGFLLQAGSAVLQSKNSFKWRPFELFLLFISISSIALSFLNIPLSKTLFSLLLLYLLLYTFNLILKSKNKERTLESGAFFLYGLFVLFLGLFFNLTNPQISSFLLLNGVVAITLGAKQQFIMAFCKGKRLGSKGAIVVLILFILGGALHLLAIIKSNSLLYNISGIFYFLSFLTIFLFCKLWRIFSSIKNSPLPLGVLFYELWIFLAALSIIFSSLQISSLIVHLLAVGTISLLLPISIQINANISKTRPEQLKWYFLVLAWQVIAFFRIIYFFYPPSKTVFFTGISLFFIIALYWTYLLARGSFYITWNLQIKAK